MNKLLLLFILLFNILFHPFVLADECQGRQILTSSSCIGDGIEQEEAKLHQLINTYRSQYGLSAIPISPSLSLVANRHVRDLDENIGSLTHGWSDCSYNSNDRNTYLCMWNAPQRFKTAYPGYGYENAHGGTGGYIATAESALKSWQGSTPHNNVILNKDMWEKRTWKALGLGIYKGYAVIWFGEETDPAAINAVINPTTIKTGEGFIVNPNTSEQIWINAKIDSVEKGLINAVWKEGGSDKTPRGD